MSLRRSFEDLGPYPSLLVLALPTASIEPLKLVAVALAGEGHWAVGTAMVAGCYAFSFLIVERLFAVVKPKLLMISWFAKLWKVFVSVRTGAWRIVERWMGVRLNPESSASPRRADPSGEPLSRLRSSLR